MAETNANSRTQEESVQAHGMGKNRDGASQKHMWIQDGSAGMAKECVVGEGPFTQQPAAGRETGLVSTTKNTRSTLLRKKVYLQVTVMGPQATVLSQGSSSRFAGRGEAQSSLSCLVTTPLRVVATLSFPLRETRAQLLFRMF